MAPWHEMENISALDGFLSRHSETLRDLALRIGPPIDGDRQYHVLNRLPSLRTMPNLRVMSIQWIPSCGEITFLPAYLEELTLPLYGADPEFEAVRERTFDCLQALVASPLTEVRMVQPCLWYN
ncbi:hypothetical protein CALCODRAFT_370921 [Calocera cornea HHB12733]|uniref:Uncharacterized protein n=1 Tax=Calocera cornea HHB12733 TaxID=1353952 RepID=A0A165EH67_9BASI|nr:hypothetical protein CALCODRAFT_370921 [Calocera cornea HHB12733]